MLHEKEFSAYETEHQIILERLKQEMPPFKEADQLLELVQAHFSFDVRCTMHPKVIVLGSGFPEELIHAFGVNPYWVLGGSLQTGSWAGDAAPRDADPVSRSILGLMSGLNELAYDALILLPIVSDSTRKLAYLLRRMGTKVHTIDIPPVKNEYALLKYEQQLELCTEALTSHTGKHLMRKNLCRAASLVAKARHEIRRFLRLAEENHTLLSAPWQMLICFSYYCANNITQWSETLTQLNDKIEASNIRKPEIPSSNILLMGSPIYFPNYKIPFLLQDVELHVVAQIDYTVQKAKTTFTLGLV